MQSADYVPGVSGWKINQHFMEVNGGPWGPARIGDLSAASAESAGKEPRLTSSNGAVDMHFDTGNIKLAGIEACAESGASLCIDPSQKVEPLRMGKVTFYGESARQIRAANAVLQSAGMGQLEVVKRANEAGEPFVVVDGQVFINAGAFEVGKIDTAISIKAATLDNGSKVMTGLISELREPMDSHLEGAIRRVIREELKPGGMLHCR